jgi:hypothetical protein
MRSGLRVGRMPRSCERQQGVGRSYEEVTLEAGSASTEERFATRPL